MSNSNDESSPTDIHDARNRLSFDISKLGAINNEALANIVRLNSSLPDLIEPIKNIQLSLTPTFVTMLEQTEDIKITVNPAFETILEQAKNINLTLTPSIATILEQAKNIQIIPNTLNLDLPEITSFLTKSPELINPLKTESELIFKQNETIKLLEEVLSVQKNEFKKQNALLNVIFRIILELKEEQRLEHPFVDKLYQMALEWGTDPISDDDK